MKASKEQYTSGRGLVLVSTGA